MIPVLRAFWAYHKAGVALMFQYRAEIILWSIWGLVNPLVLMLMMRAAAEGNAEKAIAGMDAARLSGYYFVIMVVGHLTGAWDTYEMGYYIRSGRMSALLLRPMLPIWKSLAENLSYKVATMGFVLPAWLLFIWLIRPAFAPHAWQLGAAVLATILAGLLNFLMCYTMALISFWATKLDAVGEVWFGLSMFFGGRVFPIDALPGPLEFIARTLPFQYVSALPAELAIGRVHTPSEALVGLAMQAVWLIVTLIVFRLMWAAAVKRHAAVGA